MKVFRKFHAQQQVCDVPAESSRLIHVAEHVAVLAEGVLEHDTAKLSAFDLSRKYARKQRKGCPQRNWKQKYTDSLSSIRIVQVI